MNRLRNALNMLHQHEQGLGRPSLFRNEPAVDYGQGERGHYSRAFPMHREGINPKALNTVLGFDDSPPSQVSELRTAQKMYVMDDLEAPFREAGEQSLREQIRPFELEPDVERTNVKEIAEEFKENLDDPQARRKFAELAANQLVLQRLGLVGGIGAGVGGIGLIANASQGDSNGNLLINPVTTTALTAAGAGLGAGMLGRRSVKDKASFYYGLPADVNQRGGKREHMLNRHNRAVDKLRDRRGLRVGATTAGAVTLLNLIDALKDK